MRRFLALPLFLSLGLLAAPRMALAAPGDAAAVLAHCGAPQSDNTAISEVDGLPQRTLAYGGTRLNFQQLQGVNGSGWSFTSGWAGILPVSAREVAARMPCFRAGLEESGAKYENLLRHTDPTIAEQSGAVVGQAHGAFGISHLWLIVFLVGVVAIFVVAVPRRKHVVRGPNPQVRPYRRPNLAFKTFRRVAQRGDSERL